jgi:penicillin-binding protein 2
MNASPIARRPGATRELLWVQLAVALVFVALVARLWHLQVMSGDHYFRRSNDNFVKEVELKSSRGVIYDRKRRVLAENRPAYDIYLTPRFVTDESLNRLGRFLALDEATLTSLRARIASKKAAERYKQILAVRDISRDALALVESELGDLPGVQIEAETERVYPHADIGAHAIGYLNEVTADELNQHRQDGYRPGDLIGRAGLEHQWESFLRGKDGRERIIVDARGRKKTLEEVPDLAALLGADAFTPPTAGLDLVTTLDFDMMNIVDKALRKHRAAAAVVVDVETGYLLAIGSSPSVDPNKLERGLSRDDAERLTTDPGRPLIDKALRENYFPGSTFKIVPMLAALKDGYDPSQRVTCHGAITYGRRTFHCLEVHGSINLLQALAQSCNVYFYELGDKLGIDRMAEVAGELGFGTSTGLGLNGEVPGFMPTVEDYKKQGGGFQKGMTLNTAIGQGSVKLTLLQVAMAYAAIANGGQLWMPQVVQSVETPEGKIVQSFPPRLRRQLPFSAESLSLVRHALYDAVNVLKGTSFQARVPGFEVAGKTGTAQVKNSRRQAQEGDEDADHAWFASFAPFDHPKIAVVVLVEHGGFGAKAATPSAMEIYRGWYEKVAPEERPASYRSDAVSLTAAKANRARERAMGAQQ